MYKKQNENCLICGKPLGRDNKYCSKECKRAARNNAYDHIPKKILVCEVCGSSFESHQSYAKYCSDKCSQRAYMDNNRESRYFNAIRRKHAIKSLPHTLTREQWIYCLEWFGNCCAYCGEYGTKLEKEHVVPVARGGGFTVDNIVPACPKCNNKKRARDDFEIPAKILEYFWSLK